MFDDVKSTFEVPRVERLSRREFEEGFLFPQRPVIVSGATEGWPARERWTNDYLKEKVGARTVRPFNAYSYDPNKGVSDMPPMKLAEYIDLLAGDAISDCQLYAGLLPIRTTLPELWPDVHFPPFVDEDKYRAVNLWFGPGNNYTPLHHDPRNNFLAQIRGRKQVILCPPREIARLYPFPFSYVGNAFSQVNVLSPDLTRFPAWAHADRALVELGPGDMLFIPVYWWHAVWGIDQNISVNYWWSARPADLLQHPRQTARAIINYRNYRAQVLGRLGARRHGAEGRRPPRWSPSGSGGGQGSVSGFSNGPGHLLASTTRKDWFRARHARPARCYGESLARHRPRMRIIHHAVAYGDLATVTWLADTGADITTVRDGIGRLSRYQSTR